MNIVVIGSIAFDDVVTDHGTVKNALGGSALYFSAAASIFAQVSIVGVLGEDFPLEELDFLKKRGVDTKSLEVVKGGKTFRWGGSYETDMNIRSTTNLELNVFQDFHPVLNERCRKSEFVFLGNINPELQLSVLEQIDSSKLIGADTIECYIQDKPEVFKTQLRAILRAAAHGNVRVLFPMISGFEEVCQAKQLLEESAESLDKDGTPFNRDIEIGIMIEVPSAVIMADVLADSVDFFSIGTNDLIQYSLAIDRTNRHVAHLYHPLHPANIRMIKHVADVARDKGIKIFMCGEMAGDPIHIPILLATGMDELSMNPQSIPAVKSMIRSLKLEDTKRFMEEVLKQATAADVEALVHNTYGSILSDKVYAE